MFKDRYIRVDRSGMLLERPWSWAANQRYTLHVLASFTNFLKNLLQQFGTATRHLSGGQKGEPGGGRRGGGKQEGNDCMKGWD